MKTYWALGGDAGRPAGDIAAQLGRNGAPEALIWMEQHGIDFTAVGALIAVALLAALSMPWGQKLPRSLLLLSGWLGTATLAPYGFATIGAVSSGYSIGDPTGWSPWVGLIGGTAFAGLGTALGVCTHYFRRMIQLSAELT